MKRYRFVAFYLAALLLSHLARVWLPGDAPGNRYGRILVERLWPRGLSKADATIDHWAKHVAPTPALRIWFGHRPERWRAFRTRYRAELHENHAAIEALLDLCAGERVTFVFAAKDVHRNGALVLKDYLEDED